jgi:DNA processing protein
MFKNKEAERLALLRLHLEPKVSLVQARQLFEAFDAPSDIFKASVKQLCHWLPSGLAQRISAPTSPSIKSAMQGVTHWATQPHCQWLTWLDAQYPVALSDLTDAPPVLYARGDVGLLGCPAIAVVGARAASFAGHQLAFNLCRDLALAQWTVISGLAQGIDASAHRGALSVAGQVGQARTVAVMGTGMDQIYPARHQALADAIVDRGGLLLTEATFGTALGPHLFPRRNRLVAALGRATVVVQAKARSGSLITARLANELGRDVFAVPGPAGDALFEGCHGLIRQGAGLLESADDLWRAFGLLTLAK